MKLVDRLNRFLHKPFARRVIRFYNRKISNILKLRPDLNSQVELDIKVKHLELYKKLGIKYDDSWLRFYSNISGIKDYRYVPESIYAGIIERTLNDCDCANHEYEDKNLLYKLIDQCYLPITVIRYIRGVFYDDSFNYVSDETVDHMLHENHGPLIGKIAVDSSGGKGVKAFYYVGGRYVSNDDVLLTSEWIRDNYCYYVVQQKLEQCAFSAMFNSKSVNTCRIITLRCPWNGKVVVLKAFMRLGSGEGVVDNLSSGGISVAIDNNGFLDDSAYSYRTREKLSEHPLSKIRFSGLRHPFYDDMCGVVVAQALKIPNHNIISWDVIADQDGNIKIIEMNLVSQNPDIPQMAYGPLFGEYTEDIVNWVVTHRRYDAFSHLRTF